MPQENVLRFLLLFCFVVFPLPGDAGRKISHLGSASLLRFFLSCGNSFPLDLLAERLKGGEKGGRVETAGSGSTGGTGEIMSAASTVGRLVWDVIRQVLLRLVGDLLGLDCNSS